MAGRTADNEHIHIATTARETTSHGTERLSVYSKSEVEHRVQ